MPQIKYADMHCDTVTVCCDADGEPYGFSGQINLKKLRESGCSAQCFAIFTEGKNSSADFKRYAEFYSAKFANNPLILPVQRYSDMQKAQNGGKIAAILTVENLGFTGGDLSVIPDLKKLGVHMASLVWNNANCFAYPNLIFEGGKPLFEAREKRGLTALGKDAVRALNDNKIIVDISHLSDGGAEDVLNISNAPIVASHSNCAAVCNVCRNLTDGQLKKIAESGGVAGLNFCRDFVGGESAFESLCLHLKHMIKVGGEDLPALGSDFDGIPPYEELGGCEKVQSLLEYFAHSGIPPRVLDKVAYGNFARVFKEVVG